MTTTVIPKTKWAAAGDVLRGLRFRLGMNEDRMAILAAVWEKEAGGFSRHWQLSAVRKGILYIKPRSPAAAQELQLRAPGLMRGLNKYFKTPWIKGVKQAAR